MKFDWIAIAELIHKLSQLAMEWYKMVSDDDEPDEENIRRTVSRVLDPSTPEQTVREVIDPFK